MFYVEAATRVLQIRRMLYKYMCCVDILYTYRYYVFVYIKYKNRKLAVQEFKEYTTSKIGLILFNP